MNKKDLELFIVEDAEWCRELYNQWNDSIGNIFSQETLFQSLSEVLVEDSFSLKSVETENELREWIVNKLISYYEKAIEIKRDF